MKLADNRDEMNKAREQLNELFTDLNVKIEEINRGRRRDGLLPVEKAKVRLLGQLSLLAHEKVSLILSLKLCFSEIMKKEKKNNRMIRIRLYWFHFNLTLENRFKVPGLNLF